MANTDTTNRFTVVPNGGRKTLTLVMSGEDVLVGETEADHALVLHMLYPPGKEETSSPLSPIDRLASRCVDAGYDLYLKLAKS